MRNLLPVCTFLASVFLSSCTTIAEHFPGVYAIDVQQGNIIDQDMINQLRPSMNKRQVLYILGSPMLVDVFHQKRWEYIYSEQKGGGARLQSRISLFFENDILTGVQGDIKPSELPVVKPSTESTVDVPKRPDDKTFFGEIGKLFTSDDAEAPEISADADEQQHEVPTPEVEKTTEEVPELTTTEVPPAEALQEEAPVQQTEQVIEDKLNDGDSEDLSTPSITQEKNQFEDFESLQKPPQINKDIATEKIQ